MGTDVFQGPTSFAWRQTRSILSSVCMNETCSTPAGGLQGRRGGIYGHRLLCVPGAACDSRYMEKLTPFVEAGSFVTLESFWGDDVWRWTYQ